MATLDPRFVEIRQILQDAGYHRARITSIEPFDLMIGGLAWCVTMCNASVEGDIDLVFHEGLDHLTIGQKIKTAERIIWAIASMRCPHPLQAHQIKGHDYQPIKAVVQWLVKEVREVQQALGDINTRYTVLSFDQSFKPFEDEISAKEAELSRRREASQQRRVTKVSRTALGELVTAQAADILEARRQYTVKAEEQAEVAQALYSKRNREVCAQLAEDVKALEVVVADLETKVATEKEDLKATRDEVIAKKKEAKISAKKMARSLEALASDGDSKVRAVYDRLCKIDSIRTDAEELRPKIEEEGRRLEERLAEAQAELEAFGEEDSPLMRARAALKKEEKRVQAVSDALEQLSSSSEDTHGQPTGAELGVFHRRIATLFEEIGIHMEASKEVYGRCNTLTDLTEHVTKEDKLMQSILARYKGAAKSSKKRDAFITELTSIANTVDASVAKAEARMATKTAALTRAEGALNAALDTLRMYSRLVEQLRRDGDKNIALLEALGEQ
ncbi:Protein of unknown function DUF2037 [Carpediemonas membranifera]|uniref:CCDC93 coiled-coil domain-containing protein n=1 Tax=Carpediemonas membranifera TaxID=201153 RepID=A0A8J6AR50_9EUKA|nr:Protein of unknown function DUF2037 [Carpediemonas membranifera]|eukprot:KAG9390035.1 Protein of unknown function DUF2037 [Carpediemonas membranifera]